MTIRPVVVLIGILMAFPYAPARATVVDPRPIMVIHEADGLPMVSYRYKEADGRFFDATKNYDSGMCQVDTSEELQCNTMSSYFKFIDPKGLPFPPTA
jgi:hypothetical protein